MGYQILNEASISALRRKQRLWPLEHQEISNNKNIKHGRKNETSGKMGYQILNEASILALR